jgi:hypothetical protein
MMNAEIPRSRTKPPYPLETDRPLEIHQPEIVRKMPNRIPLISKNV